MAEDKQGLFTEEECSIAVERIQKYTAIAIAYRMLKSGESVDYVIKYTKLSKEDVFELQKKNIELRYPLFTEEVYKIAFEKGHNEVMREIAEKGLKKGYSSDFMAELTSLSTDKVDRIKKEIDEGGCTLNKTK